MEFVVADSTGVSEEMAWVAIKLVTNAICRLKTYEMLMKCLTLNHNFKKLQYFQK